MAEWVELKANDGQDLQAYVARPEGESRGSVVVVQEIFGVNKSVRSVADGFAKAGYCAIAPALFDRIERGVELGYEGEDMKKAYELYGKLSPETALLDVAAAFHFLQKEDQKGVGVVGFCYGGFMSWLAATRGDKLTMRPACCVGYYPGGIGSVATEEPSCPVMVHFGGDDSHIGEDQIEAVRNAHSEVEIFVYPGAKHGFSNHARADYNPQQATLAGERTLEFLKKHLA